MIGFFNKFLLSLVGSGKDLVPIVVVVVSFQILVLQQPIPNLVEMLVGLSLVILGLNFFINGLEMGLFPIGESMADDFATKGSLFWLIVFAFALGFGTTIAEPARSGHWHRSSENRVNAPPAPSRACLPHRLDSDSAPRTQCQSTPGADSPPPGANEDHGPPKTPA